MAQDNTRYVSDNIPVRPCAVLPSHYPLHHPIPQINLLPDAGSLRRDTMRKLIHHVGISADGWIAADGSPDGFPVIFGSGVPLVTGSMT